VATGGREVAAAEADGVPARFSADRGLCTVSLEGIDRPVEVRITFA
jgi:hypothetical protein